MKSIGIRSSDFLILYPSLSRLAIWIERIAVNVEIVGSSLTTYSFFVVFFIFYHKSWLAWLLQDLRVKVNVKEFIWKHYIS